MTQVKATCPSCGEVEMPHQNMTLMVCDVPWHSYYEFPCPAFHLTIRKDTDDRIAQLLLTAGVRADMWHLPLEAIEQHDGPALTMDDLLDFTIGLSSRDIIAELLDRS